MEHARPPTELLVEGGPVAGADAWRKWRKQFEDFLKASGLSNESEAVKASLLVNLIGPVGYKILSTFTYSGEESDCDLQCLLKKFDDHFEIKPNVTMSRFKFFSRNQKPRETINQFVTSLRRLSETCEFGNLSDSLIKDRIVCGIASNTVRHRLLRSEDLTLANAVEICEDAELSNEGNVKEDVVNGALEQDVENDTQVGACGYVYPTESIVLVKYSMPTSDSS